MTADSLKTTQVKIPEKDDENGCRIDILVDGGRIFELLAESEAESQRWISVLSASTDNLALDVSLSKKSKELAEVLLCMDLF